jgi:hypothetical protein
VTGSGPSCGDGVCSATESPGTCAADCGSPPAIETLCGNGIDDDFDGDLDCADADCLGGSSCPVGTLIFSDDFESGNLSTGGWTATGNAQIHGGAAYDGSYGVKLQKVGGIEKAISTQGRFGLFIEYHRITMKFEPGDDSFDVEWYDGQDWHLIESTADTSWGHTSVSLPPAADDNPDFRIRFTCNGNHPIEKVHLDNVQFLD